MKEQILELRKQGKTYNEIKKELNCSKGTIAYHCSDIQKIKVFERNKERKQRNIDWLNSIRKELSCKCGENRWWVLDFHHLNPKEKDKSVSQMLKSASRKRVTEEINKCEVLCANCHRDLHYKEKQASIA